MAGRLPVGVSGLRATTINQRVILFGISKNIILVIVYCSSFEDFQVDGMVYKLTTIYWSTIRRLRSGRRLES